MYRSIALSARKAASEVERNNTSGRNTPRAGQRPGALWLRRLIWGFLIGDSRSTSLRPGRHRTQCPKPRQTSNAFSSATRERAPAKSTEASSVFHPGPRLPWCRWIRSSISESRSYAEATKAGRAKRASAYSSEPALPAAGPASHQNDTKNLSPPFHQSTIISGSTAQRINRSTDLHPQTSPPRPQQPNEKRSAQ